MNARDKIQEEAVKKALSVPQGRALAWLQSGDDLDARGFDGDTAAIAAARSGAARSLEALAWGGADLNLKDRDGRSAMDWARQTMTAQALAKVEAARDRRELINGLRAQLRLLESLPAPKPAFRWFPFKDRRKA